MSKRTERQRRRRGIVERYEAGEAVDANKLLLEQIRRIRASMRVAAKFAIHVPPLDSEPDQ